ncbi:MAG TPA: polysaccharide deacetylase family protein [Hyphomicrobiaceae bacterium]|nr:polysaccharide deacetylase family protein [Hyphomicrobiaceae bacterium]
MSQGARRLRKVALSALHYSGADSVIAPFTRGVGAILTLHHVFPGKPGAFEPNRDLKVTPEFIVQVIQQVRAAGFEIVSLDEAHFRLVEGEYGRPFVCFAFDDGYRDLIEHAYPVFGRYDLPFAVYVATDYPSGHGELWWLGLERVIIKVGALDAKIDGTQRRLRCGSAAEKDTSYRKLYGWLRSIDENDARGFVRELCASVDVDLAGLGPELMLSWKQIRELGADARVTIGSHTRRHYALAKLTLAEARAEIEEGVRRLERETGLSCRHFAYPYGDQASAGPREFDLARELGLKTAVTMRSGLIHAQHRCALTALPSISLSGEYQHPRYVKVALSGAPFAFSGLTHKGTSQTSAAP